MSLYTRWSINPVIPLYNCGQVSLRGNQVTLLLVRHEGTNAIRGYYKEFLKADEGLSEIEKVIKNLPEVELSSNLLKAAIKDAE